jgi:cytosine/uracil/thiamine/allantoin permease
MVDKRGKLATLLFIGVTILPLLGLMMMDYQLRKANDITGAYLVSGPGAYAAENIVGALIVICLLVAIVAVYAVGRVKHSKLVSTMPLAKINSEISRIDEHLKQKK